MPNPTPTIEDLLAHAPWLRRLAIRLARDVAAADDLVQETFLSALEGRRQGQPLGPWLARVLRRKASRQRRSQDRRTVREAAVSREESAPATDVLTARAEASRVLVDCVLELPEVQRRAILLRYFEELDTARIASMEGVSEEAVRARLHRGRAALREALERRRAPGTSWLAALAPLTLDRSVLSASASPVATPSLLGFVMASYPKALAATAVVVALVFVPRLLGGGPPTSPGGPARSAAGGVDDIGTLAPLAPADRATARDAAAAATASLHGIVRDPQTGHPVPHLALVIAAPSGGTRVPVRTGADGRFQVEAALAVGPLIATVMEDRAWTSHAKLEPFAPSAKPRELAFTHPGDGGTVELEVLTGPTYRIAGGLPPSWSDDGATAYLRTPDTRSSLAVMSPDGSRPAPEGPYRYLPGLVVEGDEVLLRFAPSATPDAAQGGVHVGLGAGDGSWFAGADAGDGRSWPLEELVLATHKTAHLTLRVEDERGGAPRAFSASLVLLRTEDGRALPHDAQTQLWRTRSGVFDPEGDPLWSNGRQRDPVTLTVPWLPLGEVELSCQADAHEPASRTIELLDGDNRAEILLRRDARATGTLSGVVTTRSGSAPEVPWVVWVERVDPDGPAAPMPAPVEGSDEGASWAGSFRVEGLLPGRYALRACPGEEDPTRTTCIPESLVVETAGAPVVLELDDVVQQRSIDLTVVDEGGKPVPAFDVNLLPLPLDMTSWNQESHTNGHAVLPLAHGVRDALAIVLVKGRMVSFVHLEDLQPGDLVRRATATVHGGWSAPVIAMREDENDRQRAAPVAGVEVRLDGVFAGRTDENGLFLARRERRPGTIAVELPGSEVLLGEECVGEGGELHPERRSPRGDFFLALVVPRR